MPRNNTSSDEALISDLIYRRVPQVLAGYLGVTWTLFELMQWLTDNYLVSPHLGRAILFGLLMLLPTVVLVTYRHGRPGPDQWTPLERWGTAANILLALCVLGFTYGDSDLGSMMRTVRAGAPGATRGNVADDTSAGAVRQVPKKEFRKRISLFYFDEADGTEADTALQRATANAFYWDLDQDNFISTHFIQQHASKLRDRNYGHGLGVPLALKREIAKWEESAYILSGSVGRTGGRFRLITRLHETKTGRELSKHTFEGEKLFPLVDRATRQLKEDLQLPRAHRERVVDLPVTQVFTSSLEAAKRFAEGYHLRNTRSSRDKHRRALENYSRATEIDSTFALAHVGKGTLHRTLGRQEKSRQSLRKARRHDYRLSESGRYWVKTFWLSAIERRLEEALRVSERWTELYPYDSRGWKMKASIHEDLLEYRAALESYQNALDVFPNSKDLQFKVGEWLLITGNLQDAARHFTSLTEKYSGDPAVYTWLGIARWKLESLKAAEKALNNARRIDREAVDERWVSSLYQATGRFKEAREVLKPPTRGEADREDGYSLLHHYWLRGRVEKTRSVLDSLWTADTGYPDFHRYYLSQRACNYRRYGYEVEEKEKYISHMKDFGASYGGSPRYKVSFRTGLGNCFAAAGNLESAKRHLAAADSIVERTDPSFRRSSHLGFYQGRLQEEQGNYGQAANHYERFLKVHAAHSTSTVWGVGRPRLRLALTYQKGGNPEKARKAYQNALTLYPAHPDLNFHYGRFLLEQGRAEEAQKHLSRALEGWVPADSSFAPKRRAQMLLDSLGTGLT